MTRRCMRLAWILMLGALLGACAQPPDPKATPRIPAPESESSPEQQSEDHSQPSGEQTAEHQESEPALEQESSGAEPQTQGPNTPEPAQTGEGAVAQTEDEVVAVLDRRLEKTLHAYDEQIHEEFEKAQAERQESEPAYEPPPAGDGQEPGSGSADGTGGDPEQGPENQSGPLARTDSGPSSPETGGQPESRGEGRQGSQDKGSRRTTPADIPSGDDDDVVARQLREAAQKESDPVLREKLWDEYRKYKRQQANVNTPPSTVEH